MIKIILVLLSLLFSFNCTAADYSAVESKLMTALAADIRTDAEKMRDRNRNPIETLEFFGLRDNMKIVELLPGGGWYTKLLAPVMRENGEFFVALRTNTVKERLADQPGFDHVQFVAEDANIHRPEGARFYELEMNELGVSNVDMAFTFRNYHNFAPAGRAAMNAAVFKALKPGGIYAVVDHNRRHMQANDNENRRRVDPVLAIREIQAAGFILVGYSDLHYRPDDELRYEVGRATVTGNTDRWTMKFRKPK
jgi:predicted methyltransferase